MVTREDFNIEDIHCQMVFKVQRNNQLLREIEGDGIESMPLDLLTETHQVDEFGKSSIPPQLVEIMEVDEILCGDYCSRPAISWGRDDSKPKI